MASQEVFEFRGVDKLVYAEVLSDTKSSIVFGPVKWLSPVAEVGRTTSTSSESHYYDNKPMIVISSTGSDELSLTVAPIDLPTYADITGQKFDVITGALIEGERSNKYYAIGYRTKGTDGKYRYVWRYKGQFGIPDETNATEDDGTTTNNTSLTWTGVSTVYEFTKTKAAAKAMICDERLLEDYDFDRFFEYVHTPDNTDSGTPVNPAKVVISPADETTFDDSLIITISCDTPGAVIRYHLSTSQESTPVIYTGPITITETTTITAFALNGPVMGAQTVATFTKNS